MGEWSEYFEDFPEEDPANWIDGRFDPEGAATRRLLKARVAKESAAMRAEIDELIKKHSRPAAKAKDCPE